MKFRGVELVYWNPRRSLKVGPLALSVPLPRRVGNFGDLITPRLVPWAYEARRSSPSGVGSGRLLAVGPILHFAKDGDVVWGSGINGKVPLSHIRARSLRVCAVRGPRTADALTGLGLTDVPSVYGDPALLFPSLAGISRSISSTHEIVSIPNLNDHSDWSRMPGLISPRADPLAVLERIASSDFVVSSSLHGLVLADALGVPSGWMQSKSEHPFKYLDYFEGTGRFGLKPARSISAAMDNPVPPLNWSPEPLLEAFPMDLWDDRS